MSGKTLVIAEKPSVAGDIARALGGMKRNKDYYEGEEYIVSSAVGHLLEMIAPEGVEVKRGKWSLVNLPVLPNHLALQPIKKTESRLQELKKLYARKDVEQIINACDAGREGELIFHNLFRFLTEGKKIAKPIKRLWLQSMTPTAIRRGFDMLRDNEEMSQLQKAAVCRAEADWLVGINSTRALTALNSSGSSFSLTTVGRVQTPTLAIIVEREKQIKDFSSQTYWEIRGNFLAKAGSYHGLWIDTAKKTAEKPERLFDEETAKNIIEACKGKEGIATEIVKPTTESPPLLFDLTSLQREANSRFSMSARGVLSSAQSLYERYKLITYPRTDSRALPEDYPSMVQKTLTKLLNNDMVGEFAQKILDNNWVKAENKRIFNNAKISDHFAIIPTGELPSAALRDNERKLYDVILRRFLAIFYPPAQFLITERQTTIDSHTFLTKGKVIKEKGWREVAAQVTKDSEIVRIDSHEKVVLENVDSEKKNTLPPPRYTEATLLSAMEGAGKLVEDEELREAMRERGLGTPATRASVIEGLVRESYLMRDRRDLIPTLKAQSLIRLLSVLKVDALTLPAMTGEWEYKLRQIEKAQTNDVDFMDGIRSLTTTIVEAAKGCGNIDNIEGDYKAMESSCLKCGEKVRESHRRFSCVSCDFFIWKSVASREFSLEEAETLLKGETTEELEGFRNRMGREFSAKACLKKNEEGQWQISFVFDQDGNKQENFSAEEIQAAEIIGHCPKCLANVRHIGQRFQCERGIGSESSCDFSISNYILQQEITPTQVRLLLEKGKTDIMEGFLSKRTKRPFKARLTLSLEDKSGKVGFEFAEKKSNKKS